MTNSVPTLKFNVSNFWSGVQTVKCLLWVKRRNTRYEQVFSALAPTTDITEARQGAADCSVAGVMAILLAVATLTNLTYPDNPQADQAVPSSAAGSTRSRLSHGGSW
jgi:hypothetical protein